MEIMRPIASATIPKDGSFLYEVKYDGFRVVLQWKRNDIRLISRNNKELTKNFPEIIQFCLEKQASIESILPLTLDGELVILNTTYQANFPWIQQRGRLKNEDKIIQTAHIRPATFIAFDLLEEKGVDMTKQSLEVRKGKLNHFFKLANINLSTINRIHEVESFTDSDKIWEKMFAHKGEGLVAKRKGSLYISGKNHRDWFKIKNWRNIQGVLTHFSPENSYFSVGVFMPNQEMVNIGKCKHGLNDEEYTALKELFITQGVKKGDEFELPPALCASVQTLDLHSGELREPEFASLLPDISPEECTVKKLQLDMAMIPNSIDLTNTDKLFWPETGLTKGDLLVYMREIAPYMLPFLKDRLLTLIRCPDGVDGEFFFQKSLPSYAPDFIKAVPVEDKNLIVCDHLDALLWFANHGAVEYHVPFQTIQDQSHPIEIAFDLDPPEREKFGLAIKACLLIKRLIDDLELISFVKTSGNKGLQVQIPIPKGSMTYEETAIFTHAIALTIENEYPDMFTTERLKKNRKGRLYIDYIQHGKDKTLVAPYSPRKTDEATVAVPLFWEEVNEGLSPTQFTIENVVERVKTLGCPFANYLEVGRNQKLENVLRLIKK